MPSETVLRAEIQIKYHSLKYVESMLNATYVLLPTS